jgi:hypothetical protein
MAAERLKKIDRCEASGQDVVMNSPRRRCGKIRLVRLHRTKIRQNPATRSFAFGYFLSPLHGEDFEMSHYLLLWAYVGSWLNFSLIPNFSDAGKQIGPPITATH